MLFSATVATDTPAETINKLTALIPAGQAKHYEVHVEVVPVGEEPTDNSRGDLRCHLSAIKKLPHIAAAFMYLFTAEQLKISYALSGR